MLAFAKAGFRTIGVDIDKNKTEAISQGRSYIKHIDSASIQAVQQTGKLVASTDFSVLAEADAIIMCVPHRWTDILNLTSAMSSTLLKRFFHTYDLVKLSA